MKYWPFSGHPVIHHQPDINSSEPEHSIINITWLTKFRFFESNLDSLNDVLLHFTLSLCWEIGWIDPLIPSLLTWLYRSQVTRCCLVSGSITEGELNSTTIKGECDRSFYRGFGGWHFWVCLDVCRDFLKCFTHSNERSRQDLLIIDNLCARGRSHIPTPTQEAWFHAEL